MKIVNNENININKKKIIYISPEYGFDEKINNYAGGLGLLAGDYLKEASDQNFPIIAIGLFYKEGYFVQSFDEDYNQVAEKAEINHSDLDFEYVSENDSAKEFIIEVGIGAIKFKVLKSKVKNIDLYLIDSNIEDNGEFSNITNMLYTSSRKERLLQEILLGQGAVVLLNFLKIEIDKLHINEGHAAFALLERINQLTDTNLNFKESFEIIKKKNYFTTHTPIIHGNEEFEANLLNEVLTKSSLLRYLKFEDFVKLGIYEGNEKFSMTAFAIRLTSKYNSVSKLHQKVASKMWQVIDKDIQFENVTNGIYINDWISQEFSQIKQNSKITAKEVLQLKKDLKSRIIKDLNDNSFYNKSSSLINLYEQTKIPENSFIIGFARRFAPYKRADLLFSDIAKLQNFFIKFPNVIILISGKAHPADIDGKKIIQDLLTKIRVNNLNNNIIFIENYNIFIAKKILWASDLWLNNPIRGLEACGTSGMKAALNGSINYSILDGWWDESYTKSIGFKIGDRMINNLSNIQISNMILTQLEQEILIKYEKSEEWGRLMLNSYKLIIERFSTTRMLKEYANIF